CTFGTNYGFDSW
nr:immunoglobulin heavy chain junction region [Macaca mulatta]MOX91875.1 immunoglobulin heavy chain junction region [Macaca mulatta]